MKFFVVLLFVTTITACNSGTPKQTVAKETAMIADSGAVKFQLITDSIKSPVQILAPPDHTARLFACDLGGKIFILKNDRLLSTPFIDVSHKLEQKDTTPNVRAIFSMAFHPHFAENKKFYLCYNAPADNQRQKCKLVISEFKARDDDADRADTTSERRVLEIEGNNIGDDDCEIAFGPDGYLYISTGAHVSPDMKNAQRLQSLSGKLLRIDVNKTPYGIPADNPFVSVKNARPEIWAYGLRRVWRFSFDSQSHALYGADVGDKMQEEIDLLQKGGNYGWPIKEGDSLLVKTAAADTANLIAPLNAYTHKDGICVIGGSVYHGEALSFLKNKYVFADLNGRLFSLTQSTTQQWSRQPVRVVNPPADPLLIFSVDSDEKGELYVSGAWNTKAGFKGVIYKLVHS